MNAALFTKMLSDPSVTDLKKLGYKYPQADMKEFVSLLENGIYRTLPLRDFRGNAAVYLPGAARVRLSAAKVLLTPQSSLQRFGLRAMEDEIVSSLAIEQIDTSRDSVRRILSGYAPADDSESRIYGMKKGLEFIADPSNAITEDNLHTLYQMTVAPFLDEEDRLLPGNRYRHDSVYVVGTKVEHTGLAWQKLPAYMASLVEFINDDNEDDDLLKAALIHFYFAYLHPYFDGNGRMARLLHLWYLVRQGYSSALFVPLSGYIEKSRKAYYDSYTLVERNEQISRHLDATPFLVYFIEHVYHKISSTLSGESVLETYKAALDAGQITKKEQELWQFALSAYGGDEFSTKQLERDFGRAAYATIHSFVLKFTELGLLRAQKYGSRNTYRIVE